MKFSRHWVTIVFSLLACAPASATLINRGNGMIYDNVTNLTWLQDASYARTSGYSALGVNPGGGMTWQAAATWANDLVYGGYDDWRLPKIASAARGWGITDSELGYMYYINLGNKAAFVDGVFTGPEFENFNSGPFHFESTKTLFWTGDIYKSPGSYGFAWAFMAWGGSQNTASIDSELDAWAVREGDVTFLVPEPASAALLGLGFACMCILGRRKSSQA